MRERIAIIDGARTPFCRAGGVFHDYQADDLAIYAVKEAIARSEISVEDVDELIFGNVMTPPDAMNIARIISVRAGLDESTPAFTVNRNCASGMEAIVSGANRILAEDGKVIVVGGTESMTHFPISFPENMRHFIQRLSKARSFAQKLKTLISLRPSMFKPQIPRIGDPLCDLSMGQTAEILVREFGITRQEQDEYALRSQLQAAEAPLSEEIIPIPLAPCYSKIQEVDDGIRPDQTIESLQKLRPCFARVHGTVTAGTSSQVTDGAVALVLMSQRQAYDLGVKPLGYITNYASVGLEPQRMGMGPALAIEKLLEKSSYQLKDIDLFEVNEAFAAQVLAVTKSTKIPIEKLNVNGGALALGHPLGASGARITLTLLKELKRRGHNRGIASLCVGGGQGEAIMLEVE